MHVWIKWMHWNLQIQNLLLSRFSCSTSSSAQSLFYLHLRSELVWKKNIQSKTNSKIFCPPVIKHRHTQGESWSFELAKNDVSWNAAFLGYQLTHDVSLCHLETLHFSSSRSSEYVLNMSVYALTSFTRSFFFLARADIFRWFSTSETQNDEQTI